MGLFLKANGLLKMVMDRGIGLHYHIDGLWGKLSVGIAIATIAADYKNEGQWIKPTNKNTPKCGCPAAGGLVPCLKPIPVE
ncbi:hypothetical protein DSCOOX_27450 [Desulfosarcina ovata subsp. ovata]|uniref:Uncharacterized protein n=2 Tax=Desulfosarcina ovata TaxID=83564 RepID=A0A5K8AAE6_9BACT|nr:hypothetical protein DSCOOX_27450 [Desulfosarcina ovata subsp. ovata]